MNNANRQAFFLIKKVNKAIRHYKMIDDGDQIAVAVSGGQDSLSLLRLLQYRQNLVQECYKLIAVHILGNANGPDACPEHPPLADWLASSGVEYVIEPMELPQDEPLPLNCHRCTWNRRKTIFKIAHRLGCNKVAWGHHFDDAVETSLLNLFYQGRLETMVPSAPYFKGVFTLIRPLIYVRKKELTRFARASEFPPPPPACARSDTSRRKLVADVLNLAELNNRHVRNNIFRATMRAMNLDKKPVS